MFPENLRTRLAPTPSGFLHIGNVLSFAITSAIATRQNGDIFLRIDDLDSARFRQEYLEDIFDTLSFLQIPYTEGPKNASDFNSNYSQNFRLKNYENALEKLVEKDLVYACTCSRTMFNENKNNYACPQKCIDKNIPLNTPNAAWRIKIPENTIINFHDVLHGNLHINLSEKMPGFIVRRKDGIPAYQTASLCDDIEMKINFIVRGEDLLLSTAAQLFLAEKLGENTFEKTFFLHHKLIHDEGNKLSKSNGSLSICEMRKAGKTSQEIWKMIGNLIGINDEIVNFESFSNAFNQRF